jgi:nucleoside phosphorylase
VAKVWAKDVPASIPKVYVGPIAAGEKVVASTKSAVWEFLNATYSDTLAVGWKAAASLKPHMLIIKSNLLIVRGISDLIDKKSEADASGSQEVAAQHAAAFAFEVLAKL